MVGDLPRRRRRTLPSLRAQPSHLGQPAPAPEIQALLRDCVRSGTLMGYDARAAGQALDEAAAFLAKHIGQAQ